MRFPGMSMLPTPEQMVEETADYAAHEALKHTPAYQKLHADAKAKLLAGKQKATQQGVMGAGTTIKMAMSDKGTQKKGKK